MPIQNPQKSVSPKDISCDGSADVTISFEASARLSSEPADIILLMDRSSSMWPPKLEDAQAAANVLIDMVTAASGGTSTIENGSQIGIVSFSGNAQKLLDLSTDTDALHNAINSLVFGGGTNHRQAFETAEAMLPPKTQKRQIVVMFTDGVTSGGGDPDPVAQRIKDSGAEIYCVGLMSDNTNLNKWASEPKSTHVAMTEDSSKLTDLFRKIAAEIVIAGAYEAELHETLSSEFEIIKVNSVSHGDAVITGAQTLVWNPGTVGITEKAESVSLSFEIRHIGNIEGERLVNQSLTYHDRDGANLDFPSPTIQISCGGTDVYPEPCPQPTSFTADGCADAVQVEITPVKLQGLGRVVQLDVSLKAICPNKRVAVSVILVELTADAKEEPRGIKHILVPAQEEDTCRDITLKCLQFSLPEELDATGNTDSICNSRKFAARVIANYVDTDFVCCDTLV